MDQHAHLARSARNQAVADLRDGRRRRAWTEPNRRQYRRKPRTGTWEG